MNEWSCLRINVSILPTINIHGRATHYKKVIFSARSCTPQPMKHEKEILPNIMPQISFNYTTNFSCWNNLCTQYLTPCVRYWGAALNWFQGKSCLDCQWKKYDAYYYTKFTGLQARLLCLQNQVLKILLAIFSSSTALGVFSNNGGKLGNLVRSTWNQARVSSAYRLAMNHKFKWSSAKVLHLILLYKLTTFS